MCAALVLNSLNTISLKKKFFSHYIIYTIIVCRKSVPYWKIVSLSPLAAERRIDRRTEANW